MVVFCTSMSAGVRARDGITCDFSACCEINKFFGEIIIIYVIRLYVNWYWLTMMYALFVRASSHCVQDTSEPKKGKSLYIYLAAGIRFALMYRHCGVLNNSADECELDVRVVC